MAARISATCAASPITKRSSPAYFTYGISASESGYVVADGSARLVVSEEKIACLLQGGLEADVPTSTYGNRSFRHSSCS
jgi:hypothetical protein